MDIMSLHPNLRRVSSQNHRELAALDTDTSALGLHQSPIRIETFFNGPWVRV